MGGNTGIRQRRGRHILLLALIGLALGALGGTSPAHAQFTQSIYRAADGTAYQVVRVVPPLGAGAEHQRITSIIGTATGSGGCSVSGSVSGQPAAAVVGALAPRQNVHSYDQIKRTAILLPNSVTAVNFDPNNAGKLTLGTGGTAINVCRVPGDCPGSVSSPFVPLSSDTGGIPPTIIDAVLARVRRLDQSTRAALEQPACLILGAARVEELMFGETDCGLRNPVPQRLALERDAEDFTLL